MNGAARIVLTGASSGIGAALARELAAPGRHLSLFGRDAARLGGIADEVRARGAGASTHAVLVTDRAAMAAALACAAGEGPPDLVIANAGGSAGTSPGGLPEADGISARMIDTNLMGMLNTVEPVLPGMIARRAGRIVLMSSIAALRPHGDLPSYSASKAGVRAWGIAMRSLLRPHGVGVTVVCPGFVTSPMSARHRGLKPFEIPAGRAAHIIVRGIRRGAPTITFPWQLALLVWLENLLPAGLADRLERGFAAEILPDTAPDLPKE